MDRIEVVGSAVVRLYLAWVVFTALRSGALRYRTRVHQRGEAPKSYWSTVAWFGVLAGSQGEDGPSADLERIVRRVMAANLAPPPPAPSAP